MGRMCKARRLLIKKLVHVVTMFHLHTLEPHSGQCRPATTSRMLIGVVVLLEERGKVIPVGSFKLWLVEP